MCHFTTKYFVFWALLMSMFWLSFAYVGLVWSWPMLLVACLMIPYPQVKVTVPSEKERAKQSFFRGWNKGERGRFLTFDTIDPAVRKNVKLSVPSTNGGGTSVG